MNEKELQEIQGRTLALSMTLNAIITTLPALAAANAAAHLKAAQLDALLDDDENETPPAEAFARSDILGVYGDLLSAVAKKG